MMEVVETLDEAVAVASTTSGATVMVLTNVSEVAPVLDCPSWIVPTRSKPDIIAS